MNKDLNSVFMSFAKEWQDFCLYMAIYLGEYVLSSQSSKWKLEVTGLNQVLELIFIYSPSITVNQLIFAAIMFRVFLIQDSFAEI
jgi:hypothetical protein